MSFILKSSSCFHVFSATADKQANIWYKTNQKKPLGGKKDRLSHKTVFRCTFCSCICDLLILFAHWMWMFAKFNHLNRNIKSITLRVLSFILCVLPMGVTFPAVWCNLTLKVPEKYTALWTSCVLCGAYLRLWHVKS